VTRREDDIRRVVAELDVHIAEVEARLAPSNHRRARPHLLATSWVPRQVARSQRHESEPLWKQLIAG
jgi:hypothetical protein